MSAQVFDITTRRLYCAPRSVEVLDVAMYELANAASAAELLRAVARITAFSECQLRRSWGGDEGLKRAAIRRALTLAFG